MASSDIDSQTAAQTLPLSTGALVDKVLYAARTTVPQDASDLIYWARGEMRNGRPNADWIWSQSVEAGLGGLDTDPTPHESLILDAIAIANGAQGRSLAYLPEPPFDERLELTPFHTSDSFEMVAELFTQHMEHERDPLDVVVRGHLWIEVTLNELIQRAATLPDELQRANLTFSKKLAVAVAFGAIPADQAPAIRLVNSLRNRLAHDVRATVTIEDQQRIIAACTPVPHRTPALAKDRDVPDGIRLAIEGIVIGLYSLIDHIDAMARYRSYRDASFLKALRSFAN